MALNAHTLARHVYHDKHLHWRSCFPASKAVSPHHPMPPPFGNRYPSQPYAQGHSFVLTETDRSNEDAWDTNFEQGHSFVLTEGDASNEDYWDLKKGHSSVVTQAHTSRENLGTPTQI